MSKPLVHPWSQSLSPPCLSSFWPKSTDASASLFKGAKLILARDSAASHGPHRGAVPCPERDPVLQCQRGRGGRGGDVLYLLRVPLPSLHDD